MYKTGRLSPIKFKSLQHGRKLNPIQGTRLYSLSVKICFNLSHKTNFRLFQTERVCK